MSRNESSITVVFADRASWGWRISLGRITAVTGGIILGWPDVTVVTVAIIVGIHLIVAGVIRMVTASLWTISVKHYGSGDEYHRLVAANPDTITDPNLIHPGEVIRVPQA